MLTKLKFEPVRLYAVTVAIVALVDYYVDMPEELFLGVIAAVLGGGGELVRSVVSPRKDLTAGDS